MSTPFLSDYLKVAEDSSDRPSNPTVNPGTNPEMIPFRFEKDTRVLVIWNPDTEAYESVLVSGVAGAAELVYDPTVSGLSATDVKAAIDELAVLIGGGGYTDEEAQDAVGAMVDGSLVYVDATPLLQRAALTGAVTAAAGSNATVLGSFTKDQLDTAVSDGNVLYVGDVTQYTDELAQDAVGGMLNANDLIYTDATPAVRLASPTYPPFTTPVDGDFAWTNDDGVATVTVNANGGIHLAAPASAGSNLRIRRKAAPATPYTITAAVIVRFRSVDFQKAGLCWRQSSDGKVIIAGLSMGNTFTGDCGVMCQDYTDENNFSAPNAAFDTMPFGVQFLRISDDGATRTFSWSTDGYNFVTVFAEARTTFLTADQVGWFCDNTNSIANGITLLSWKET